MTYFTARRLSDGLLHPPQTVPQLPTSDTGMIGNAIQVFGGSASDYELVELSQAQFDTIEASITARAYLNNETVTLKALLLSSNKAQITADGVDTATLSADSGNVNYTDNVKFTVIAPDNSVFTETIAAVAGIATTTLNSSQVGNHLITAESIEYGVKQITVEGI